MVSASPSYSLLEAKLVSLLQCLRKLVRTDLLITFYIFVNVPLTYGILSAVFNVIFRIRFEYLVRSIPS